MNITLIYPMFAVVVLTFVVGLILLRTRWTLLASGKVSRGYFKTMSTGEEVPEFHTRATRHFTNLFEVPVLFYIACLLAIVLPVYGFGVQFLAWLFVFARIGQALVNLTSNKIIPRMLMFLTSYAAVMGLWIAIVWKVTVLMSGALDVEGAP